MKYFDAHTHVNFVAYDEDREEVIQRAKDAGVIMNVVGTQQDTKRPGQAGQDFTFSGIKQPRRHLNSDLESGINGTFRHLTGTQGLDRMHGSDRTSGTWGD